MRDCREAHRYITEYYKTNVKTSLRILQENAGGNVSLAAGNRSLWLAGNARKISNFISLSRRGTLIQVVVDFPGINEEIFATLSALAAGGEDDSR